MPSDPWDSMEFPPPPAVKKINARVLRCYDRTRRALQANLALGMLLERLRDPARQTKCHTTLDSTELQACPYHGLQHIPDVATTPTLSRTIHHTPHTIRTRPLPASSPLSAVHTHSTDDRCHGATDAGAQPGSGAGSAKWAGISGLGGARLRTDGGGAAARAQGRSGVISKYRCGRIV